MAIGINNVYQKVLALANKEQRGYITPQEFNLFADQAQMEIFEQYFYDLEQRQRAVGNEFDYADMVNSIEEKISVFEKVNQAIGFIDNEGNIDVSSSVMDSDGNTNLYKLGDVKINYPISPGVYEDFYYPVEQIQLKELNLHSISSLKTFSKKRPVYTKHSESLVPVRIQIHPPPPSGSMVMINYIVRPKRPNWTYVLSGNNAKYIYHFADEALRVCNTNEENTSMVKWYGYIQRQQFNNQKGALFAEWQEHPNSLASPKIAEGTFTYCYGHTTHDGSDNSASYYQNNRGVARVKKDSTSDLRLNGSHNDSTTAFTFENSSSEDVLDQALTGEAPP